MYHCTNFIALADNVHNLPEILHGLVFFRNLVNKHLLLAVQAFATHKKIPLLQDWLKHAFCCQRKCRPKKETTSISNPLRESFDGS